jgi:hypothetical protein
MDAYGEYYTYMMSQERQLHDATQEMWRQTGEVIRQSLSQGIYDLIQGTASAKDVILNMYSAITQAAIDYLVQLIMIKTFQMAMNMMAPGSGDIMMLAGSGGAKNGATFQRFANGGAFTNKIVMGPTNFASNQMGEAGPEGVLPLTNVNGKLGVHASGGRGDNYTINIQAVDAPSVRRLFMEHGDVLVDAMVGQGRLNNGVGRRK